MTHEWHDTYRHKSTPAHHLDPRTKLFVALAFIGIVLFTSHWGLLQILGFAAFLFAMLLMAELSLPSVLARAFSLWPFALLMVLSMALSRLSVHHAGEVLMKSLFSVWALTLVSMTTPFPDLLRALEQSRVPKLMVMFLAFLYRYGAVLGKEAVKVERGWAARSFGRFWWREWWRLGHVLGALLVRSYERAERIYAAMLSRGFSSQMPSMHLLHFGIADLFFTVLSLGILSLIRWAPLG